MSPATQGDRVFPSGLAPHATRATAYDRIGPAGGALE